MDTTLFDDEQDGFLVDTDEDWKQYWNGAGMPRYVMRNLQSIRKILVRFARMEDREWLLGSVNRKAGQIMEEENMKLLTPSSTWTHWPPVPYNRYSKRPEKPIKTKPNKYPVYIVSKGRWNFSMTAKYLNLLTIPFHLVIERAEKEKYLEAGVARPDQILLLPDAVAGSGCSIPARNFVWDHALKNRSVKHWILDDNIRGFYCMNNNEKNLVHVNPFIPVEQFTDYFSNVGVSGMNYEFMLQHRVPHQPYYLNTRVYSCILIRNDLPFRWRGRYNEDTDLCLCVLKAGICTLLLNYMQAKKVPTGTVIGGNTDTLYGNWQDGRKKMSEALMRLHPDCVTITNKWGHCQHQVNYRIFRSLRLIRAGSKRSSFNDVRLERAGVLA